MTKNNTRIKRLLASIMTGAIILSAASAMSVTAASAVTTQAICLQTEQNSEVTDGLFTAAETLMGVVTTANPAAGIIGSGLLGAFKSFYNSSTQSSQPSNQEIVDFLNSLSDKLDQHYNDEAMQLKALASIEKLQNMSRILTSVKGYNEDAITQIGLYNDQKVCDQTYLNIIKYTSGNQDFTKDFNDLSNLIIDGETGIKGGPSFMEYLKLSEESDDNNNDAALVKQDSTLFNKMVMEQYTLYFSNYITGLNAEYNLAEWNYQHGNITAEKRDSIQESVTAIMSDKFKLAKKVCDSFTQAQNKIDDLTVAKVTNGSTTTEMFSLGDAWVYAAKNNGTIRLVKDWNNSDLSKDIYYYKANGNFKDGGLYVNGQNITLDLNGHSIVHSGSRKFDATVDNGTLNITDSSGNSGSISGIQLNGGTLNLNGITVRDASDSGVENNGGKLNADNCTFTNNSKTAVYLSNSSADIKHCSFTNNTAGSKNGGAIRFFKSVNLKEVSLNVRCCDFTNNTANEGGAIYATYDASIRDCTFRNNSSTGCGGAICFDYRGYGLCSSLWLRGSTFTGNKSGKNGGAIYCDSMNYLNLWDTTITYNEAKNAGGGLYAQKGTASSCDPEIKGKITITDNKLSNGTASNAFLGENTTSKCIFTISEKIDPNSRIGITSPTSDKTLDVARIANKTAYDNTKNVFSYDTGAYRINRYKGTFTSCYWVEIKKN